MSITLFCLVKGNTTVNAFPVRIDKGQLVGDLKKIIKENQKPFFDSVPTKDIKLWKVEISDDRDDPLSNLSLQDNDELLATREIEEYWSEKPSKKSIHVIVQPPVSTTTSIREQELMKLIITLKERLDFFGKPCVEPPKREHHYEIEQKRNVKKIRIYPSPSSFAVINSLLITHARDKEFLIGRPQNCVGAPLVLYNSVFYDFKSYYNDEELSMDDKHFQWTLEIIKLMANYYTDEGSRQKKFHDEMRKLFDQDISKITLDDQTSNDGVLTLDFHSFTVLCVLMEIKNEIGTGGCDPTTQAAASYAKFCIQQKNDKLLKGCNMPCFLIGLAGPWVCVLGAVYVEKPIVEPLTALEPLINTYDRTHILKIARLFKALRLASDKLKDYYNSLPHTVIRDVDTQRFYPFPRKADNIGEFFYIERLFDDKLLWKAETKEGSHQIVVKYTHKYNKYAHELCFDIKKAPRLLHVEMMTCGFYCVVMEYIEGKRLCDCDLTRSEYDTIISDIEEAVLYLHSKDIVFADLRDTNILVIQDENEKYHGMLVDFDWAGKNNVDSYPPLMNPDINWPDGAHNRMPLVKGHDLYWLESLKNIYLGSYIDEET